jgi:hypothetical protein
MRRTTPIDALPTDKAISAEAATQATEQENQRHHNKNCPSGHFYPAGGTLLSIMDRVLQISKHIIGWGAAKG